MQTSQKIDKSGSNNAGNVLHVRWSDYSYRNKRKVWEMLEKIGDEVVVIVIGAAKNGVSYSAGKFGRDTGRVLKIVYMSKHIVKVRFDGVV